MAAQRPPLTYFSDPAPALRVKLHRESLEKPTTVRVEHRLGSKPDSDGRAYLRQLARYSAMRGFCAFYLRHDGFELGRTVDSRFGQVLPLLELLPAAAIEDFTAQFRRGGKRAWTIDYGKSSRLYRGSDPWLAFARVNEGPACLTTFLDGANAGCVFYVTPQPPFSILRPIAKSFDHLLERIASDLAGFLRLVRAYVTLQALDGEHYGLVPIEYVPRCRRVLKASGTNMRSGTKRPSGSRAVD